MKRLLGIGKMLLNVILILLCVYSLLIDLTYAGYINCSCLQKEIIWLKGWLIPIGFRRSNALRLLQSSMGVAVTVIIFILNWGVDLFKHSERKIFGISWGELQINETQSCRHKLKFIMMLTMPLLVIGTIILDFCAVSYALLLYSYYLICGKYWNFAVGYDKKVQREKVVNKLIGFVDGEKDYIDDNVTVFYSTLENIRAGIQETESWNNAWLLFDDFLKEVMKFEQDKCFKLSGYFFEVIFDIPSEEYVQKEQIFVKRYIAQMKADNDSETIVLWSLLCNVVLQWRAEALESFLRWFLDFPRRSSQRVLCKLGKLEAKEIQRQSAMILVMLEYWVHMHEEDISIQYEYIGKIYEYGKVFLQKECEEHMLFLQTLDNLYAKKYAGKVYNAGERLYSDARYHLNNTMIMTTLKYEL